MKKAVIIIATASTFALAHTTSLTFTGKEDCENVFDLATVAFTSRQNEEHLEDALDFLLQHDDVDENLLREIVLLAYEQAMPSRSKDFANPIQVACIRAQE